jgi:hypothetical protein
MLEVVLERLDRDLKMRAFFSGGRREPRAHALEVTFGSRTQHARLSPLISTRDGSLRRRRRLRPEQRLSLEQGLPLAHRGRSLRRLGRRRSFTSGSGLRARSGRAARPRRLNPWLLRGCARARSGLRLRREPRSRPPSASPEQSRTEAGQNERCCDQLPACHGTRSLDCALMLTVPLSFSSVPRTRTGIPLSPIGLSPAGMGPST